MVLAVVDDLLFSSKIRSVAAATGQTIAFVRDRAAVVSSIRERQPSLVIFDLDRDGLDPIGAIEEIRSHADLAGVKLIGFASHVHAERFTAARAAGIDVALARSGFVTALPQLLATDASPEAS